MVVVILPTSEAPQPAQMMADRSIAEVLHALPHVEYHRLYKERGETVSYAHGWNHGIRRCLHHKCDAVMLSYHDHFVDAGVDALAQAALHCPPEHIRGFVPRDDGSQLLPASRIMACPMHAWRSTMLDAYHVFHPRDDATRDWHQRFSACEGQRIEVDAMQVHRVARRPPDSRPCLYTLNVGGAETEVFGWGDVFGDACDMLYFSDCPAMLAQATHKGWQPVYLPPLPCDSHHATEQQQQQQQHTTVKTQPHLFLPPEYDVSIYVDANAILAFVSISQMLQACQLSTHDMACWHHVQRDFVNEEVQEVLATCPKMSHRVLALRQQQARDHFPEKTASLSDTTLLVRRHRTMSMMQFAATWQSCIKSCPHDLLSFDYSAWKHQIRVARFPSYTRPIYLAPRTGLLT